MKPPLKSKQQSHRLSMGRRFAIPLLAAGLQMPALSPIQAAEPEPPAAAKQSVDSSTPATTVTAAPKAMEITDSGINSAVEDGLRSEKGVFPNDVDVSTSQGIVTLSGSAGNILAKERAAKIAESFRGVRGVIDLTIVAPESRPDVDIQRDAMTALQQDPATESYKVAVSVQGAIATLTGSTGSYAEKQLAARIVEGIKGIKGVRNDVSINYLATRTDSEITADVKARLQWDIWINGDLINTTVKDGNVTLTGSAGSVLSRSRALEDAWLNGVMSVDASAVKIEPSPKTDAHRTD